MKKYIRSMLTTASLVIACVALTKVMAQTNAIGVNGAVGLYAPMYAGTTTLSNGGIVVVGDSGNWFMAGNILSADKGDSASPNAIGRSEVITFSGTGTYSNAATTPGTKGNIIIGYAGASGKTTSFILPIGGNDSIVYPITVPRTDLLLNVSAAYFAGSGGSSTQTVGSIPGSTTVYTPFIEFNVVNGIGGNFTISWPASIPNSLGIDYIVDNNITNNIGNNVGLSFGKTYQFPGTVFNGSVGNATFNLSRPGGISRIAFASGANSVLPIALLSFTGIKVIGGNLLNWKVANAVNFNRFEVQQHTDGGNFTTIASVPYQSSNNFTYLHAGALGTNFYRLKMIDLDGSSQYSNTIVLVNQISDFMLNGIYPNPAKNVISVSTYSPVATNAMYTISDVRGSKLTTETHTISQLTTQTLDISNLANGTYLLTVNVAGVTTSKKFVKQ